MKPLHIFIGYDPREVVAYHVLSHSLITRASLPISITPIVKSQVQAAGLYTRKRGKLESTEFSLTRFLTPTLAEGGYAVFMDCDMLCQADIWELIHGEIIPRQYPVWVCKHDYIPKTTTKFLGNAQTAYLRKNWSSFMVFDCDLLRERLTPSYINTATPLALHRLNWVEDDEIGSLPLEWNWLVGEYHHNASAKILHYTLGGPWFRDYQFCDHAQDWFDELDLAFPTLNLPKLVEA